jgi:hypothetical protein
VRMLDLFCGRFGWSRAFAAKGWECICLDLIEPPEVPENCCFIKGDILDCSFAPATGLFWYGNFCKSGPFDFICASSPCEQFSVHGMKHFHPNPPYPELGIKLFEHTRAICEASGVPYVMENVRAAQQFVGNAKHHCGPFYLWGSGVPALMGQGISKAKWLPNNQHGRNGKPGNFAPELRLPKSLRKPLLATIPPELANCVCDYAERLLEQKELTR